MITFQLFKDGLYLPQTSIGDPGSACLAFLFQDAARRDPTYTLSQASWTSPTDQGYFAFFVPSATRDWSAFAAAVRALFQGTPSAQLGWFVEDGGGVTPASLILVANQGTASPSVQQPFQLAFRTLALNVATNPFLPSSNPVIAFDDTANTFGITNTDVGGTPAVRLTAQPPLGTQQTYYSSSPSLLLPMAGSQAGTVNAGFALANADLAQLEAGLMYFAAAPAQQIRALRYPAFRAPEGASVVNLGAWLDVLRPLSPTRTYFQLVDPLVGSYFTSAVGRTFALRTTNGSAIEQTSRFVLANRPVSETSSVDYYYLTPAGTFLLSTDPAADDAPATAELLCGTTGTEFFSVALASSGAGDALQFVPGNAAYQVQQGSGSASATNGSAQYLSSVDGKFTTSWVSLLTTSGNYVSQPEQSPLYQQTGQAQPLASSGVASGVYLLDFFPLAAWSASSGNGAGVAAAPAVPMVPYAGIPATQDSAPLLDMESNALNPARRSLFSSQSPPRPRRDAAAVDLTYTMTPQGMLAGMAAGNPPSWDTLQMAISGSGTLQLRELGSAIQQTLQQNQIFAVISTTHDSSALGSEDHAPRSGADLLFTARPERRRGHAARAGAALDGSLFQFTGPDQTLEIADWLFSLSPDGVPSADGTPPILILKFYPGQSIADLVADTRFWSAPDTFNIAPFDATKAQAYLSALIQQACEQVYGAGNCPNGGAGSGTAPDTNSLYYNFYRVVTDPNFSGVLAVNVNIQLDDLPAAIRAVLGGMTRPGPDGKTISNIDMFRAHHVGIQINDTNPDSPTPALSQSSPFGLVDYEKPADSKGARAPSGLAVEYNFEVEYLRALFVNAELSSFSSQINLTINSLFGNDVELQEGGAAAGDDGNVIVITGTYQAHSTSGDDGTTGEGVYSFVAEGDFGFTFTDSQYLDKITLTKLQFSFGEETASQLVDGNTSTIKAGFSIWGSMVFKQLDVLDLFSFEKLVFADLGIGVQFDLTTYPGTAKQPTTDNLSLWFAPGDLRFDLGQTTNREGKDSLLSLLPFKLKSFLYSQKADQTLDSLDYYALSAVPGLSSIASTFNYALIFDLDLGSMGGLVGALSAFKFSFIIGWLSGPDGGLALGVQLPQADGKLEITIEGVFSLVIEQFQLQYVDQPGAERLLALVLHNSYMEILGTRMPPGTALFDFALFVPAENASEIGWLAAINDMPKGEGARRLTAGAAPGDESPVFKLLYLGGGQRVGPDPKNPPTTFKEFLAFMTDDFWKAVQNKEFSSVYHRDGKWLLVSDFKLLGVVEVGFVFYDVTPFYSLVLNVEGLFDFEITYTKVSDSIGLFYANLQLPDALRTFQVGAASLTLPAIGVSVYTNGDWKLDVGFPANDDWSRSFQVQAMAGPVPVTGSGGFYLASLSSATSSIFKGTYPSILAFGFGARLGVGKDFTAGPLKAGVSVTFFGIIEGAAGYLSSGSTNIFQSPDALSLKGQFGVIGELYGTLDFKIIKASVNVRLSASIGIELYMERSIPGSGSILLYIQASVSVSVSVSINLGFFSISISFSFDATYRFDWQLAGSSSQAPRLPSFARPLAARSLAVCPGLPTSVPLWFLPEITVLFADDVTPGAPWFVASLAVEYDPAPPADPTYAQFKPFEAVTTQLVTWALMTVLELGSYASPVSLDQLSSLNQTPDVLVGWIDYDALLGQLSGFSASVSVPPSDKAEQRSATVFPMPPFLQVTTPWSPAYTFASKNLVPQTYLDEVVQTYFDQLYVNQTSSVPPGASSADATVPLSKEVFVDYFTGLVRGAVNALLQTMQDEGLTTSALDTLIRKAVGTGQFMTLAGQMSSYFRGGPRLPWLDGMTLPGPTPAKPPATASLYALLWQELPVGTLTPISNPTPGGPTSQAIIQLTNPDSKGQSWFTCAVSYALTNLQVDPYRNLTTSSVTQPSKPTQLPFLNAGPQAFSFQNAIPWTYPDQTPASMSSLRPFPANLIALEGSLARAVDALVQSRRTGAAYLPGGTPLDPSAFAWATMVTLSVKQIPGTSGSSMLPNVYAIAGASQQDQALLAQILTALQGGAKIASIQVLYQTAAGQTGLSSEAVNPADVFVLRTNTTTVSAPPTGNLRSRAFAPPPDDVAVGARIDEPAGFLQILQQASVTNAPGYYLHYQDASGHDLPSELFANGPAPLTILVTYPADGRANKPSSPALVEPYYNTIELANPDVGLLYYASTTDSALDTQYPAVAAGSVGVELVRDNGEQRLVAPRALVAAGKADVRRRYTHHELVLALRDAGVRNPAEIARALAEAGAAPAQLSALYSLLTYQVQSTTGFSQSNLSSPLQPQGEAGSGASNDSYRVFVPLYNVATANGTLPLGTPPNRYASIDDPFAIDFFVTDAFGNMLPTPLGFSGTNLYFDALISPDQWLGVVTTYDFQVGGAPQADGLSVYLTPTEVAFVNMTADQADAAATLYQSVLTQLTGLGVSMYVESNVALSADSSMVQVALDTVQLDAVETMVRGLLTYAQKLAAALRAGGSLPPFTVQPVTLSVTMKGAGALPPVFEIAVLLGIARDPSLISPLLKDSFGNIIFPAAQNVASTAASTVGSQLREGPPVSITTFAAQFVAAFPALVLSVGLNGATAPQKQSSVGRARARLRALGLPGDGSGAGTPGPQSLWAVQQCLIDIQIGVSGGPRYLAPKPLDNALNTAVVPLPTLGAPLPQLPATRLFTDVDLDQLNTSFFTAVDRVLGPSSAAHAFSVARDAYDTIADGREQIAEEYATYEVEWMFPAQSPFTGSTAELGEGQEVFEQQMRAALMTAYSIDTLVQYPVTWRSSVPSSVGDQVSLFGQVRPTSVSTPPAIGGYSLSSAKVPVMSSGPGLLTFWYGTAKIQDEASVSLDLMLDVTHVEYYLAPASQTPPGEARPSMWLQLVNPYSNGAPHIGPKDQETTIPLVYRQYPTPPTLVSQSGIQGASSSSPSRGGTSLADAAAWHYTYEYQAQITAHDQINSSITYNTDLSTSSPPELRSALAEGPFSLFVALARFSAAYEILGPILANPDDPSWAAAVKAFSACVTEVVQNTDWNPSSAQARATSLGRVIDDYVITDEENTNGRLIALSWAPRQTPSSFAGVTLSVLAIGPDGTPYPGQSPGTVPFGVTDLYQPNPPLTSDWVSHRVEVDALNVLSAENALAGVQVERNLIKLAGPDGQTDWTVNAEFVYMTPLVRFGQPITPFIDYGEPIDITTLPQHGSGPGCPDSPRCLCQWIFTMMNDLIGNPVEVSSLRKALRSAGLADDVSRRVKVQCSLRYAMSAAAGGKVGAAPITPTFPVKLARSFEISADADQIGAFAKLYAEAITKWCQDNGVAFGAAATPAGAMLVFDVTLYAQLSGTNVPVLRLGNLDLALADIDPVPVAKHARAAP
ncbi:Hypothetical protein A7982_01300 [Minicystis rosea]|nr:Hypothetical protein A7982_01300 [Minicystis rosea]